MNKIAVLVTALLATGTVHAAEPARQPDPAMDAGPAVRTSPAAAPSVAAAENAQPASAPQAAATANPPADAGPAATVSPGAARGSADRIELDATQITGNAELPRVLYVVPWKRPELGELGGRPAKSLLDEVLEPVDRDVFRRQNRYYDALQPDAAAAVPKGEK